MTATKEAKRAARKAENSDSVDYLARFGLVCRGLVWTVTSLLFLNVAVGGSSRTDKQGALDAIADQPLGEGLLALLALGFAGYGGWRFLQALVGHRDDKKEQLKRTGKRIASLARAGVYVFLAVSTVRFLFADSSPDRTKEITSAVMGFPGGRVLVGLVGAGLIVGGLVMAVRGVTQKFDDKLKTIPSALCTPVHVVAITGLISRGLLFALVGAFLTGASLTYDPDKARGLDAAVKTIERVPAGNWLIAACGLGLLCFGLWSFAEARWRKI